MHAANSLPGSIGTSRWQISHIRQPEQEEGWLACVCSPFVVIAAHRAGVRRPAACRCTQATLPGKAHDLPVCAIARPLPFLNNQRRPHAWLCNPVPMQAFGGWDDEPAATFDSAGAIVAIGYSRDWGYRLSVRAWGC